MLLVSPRAELSEKQKVPRDIVFVVDTSGWGSESDFQLLVKRSDLVLFDLKCIDPRLHNRWTGAENTQILHNLQLLSTLDIPYIVRVPLVPGITDTVENLSAIASAVQGLPGLEGVELLPYNRSAGGKYKACGMTFLPEWDEFRPCHPRMHIFTSRGVAARVT